ncbi:MAG TPA: glutamate-1-semialdehyde 2,1-aminomutase [Candidatus Dormibacteraeota bacterium]|nr:glutamate-1-semialdehyde 2,1-aminomutase [Candidatus Dormibacteraeota bacterium]
MTPDRFARARRVMPGGVNSPVRAFRAVGGDPVFIASGSGAELVDVDGRHYLDLVASYGPLILGHAHPAVVAAIREQAQRGTSYGAPTEAETELVEALVTHMPSLEMARLVNSGTEATMSAIRVARGATGRDVVVKFAGGYHGHQDYLLAEAGSGVATLGIPGSPGVPAAFTALTAVLPYNDRAATEAFFAERGGEVAAVIVEPVAGNMGVVPGRPDFLEALRALTTSHGAVLVFDEVITGFRLGLGGAQAHYGINPDLTCLGKVIGGGLPLAAYGGRRELMSMVAPEGPIYQAGTLSGNPLATAAGLATLRVLVEEDPYPALEAAAKALVEVLRSGAADTGMEVTVNSVGSMLTPFFSPGPVNDYASAKGADAAAYARLFNRLLAGGVYPPPSQFETWFISVPIARGGMDRLTALVRGAFAGL